MWLERVVAALPAELLAESPLIDDWVVWCAMRLEDRGCDETVGAVSSRHLKMVDRLTVRAPAILPD